MPVKTVVTPVPPRPAGTARAVRPGVALAVVLFGFLVLPMSMSGTTVAVPRIGADLGASGPALQWIVTGYFLAASSFMLVTGSLGDLFGRRRLYRIGAFVYLAGSVAAAAAPNIVFLDAARIVTGFGAAGVVAGGGAILATTFTGSARTRAFAAMGTTSGIGLAAGPTTAGWLVEALDWRMTFALFGAAGLVLAAGTWALAESKAETRPTVDRAGIASFIGGLVLVMFAITQGSQAGWGSARVLLPAVGGVGVLAGFVVVERRAARPMLDFGLLKNRRFTGWLLAALTMGAGFGGMLANLPTFLQGVNDASTGEAGLMDAYADGPGAGHAVGVGPADRAGRGGSAGAGHRGAVAPCRGEPVADRAAPGHRRARPGGAAGDDRDRGGAVLRDDRRAGDGRGGAVPGRDGGRTAQHRARHHPAPQRWPCSARP
ncbi:MFS transporter [Yinghuangia aomiensis]